MSKLEVKNVSAGYGSTMVVDGADFVVESGEVVVILGRNGSGKSTLLKAIIGDVPLMDGEILFDGHSLSNMDRRRRARKICMVEQDLPSCSMTVREYVSMGLAPRRSLFALSERDEERSLVNNSIETVGLTNESLRRVDELSGGQRRMCVIARTLVQNSDVILMDEPTANLDVPNQKSVINMVRMLASNGHIVICVVHDVNEALRLGTRFVLLHNGRQIYDGPADERFAQMLSVSLDSEIDIAEVKGRRVALY